MLDIVIPVLNEESFLSKHKNYYARLKEHARLIFVDGGSTDETISLASQFGEVFMLTPPRSVQKNYGAAQSQSPYMLFLNVDCMVDVATLKKIPSYLDKHEAGCLTMTINDSGFLFRFYESFVNFRARRMGVIDADLGLCIRRTLFDDLGSFDEVVIMDDVAFSRKLKSHVRIKPLSDRITVSSRRWHERGFFKTFGFYSLAYLQYWSGIKLLKSSS